MSEAVLTRSLIALIAPLAQIVATIAGPAARSVPTLAPGQLHAGQHAIVRTVFQGDSIEEFPADIVGVLTGGRAEGDMILARATSERVIRLGIAQGMSGSPVYVDGKLIGALSSGWSFQKDPLFGITPIGEMLEVLDRRPSAASGTGGPSGVEFSTPLSSVGFREMRWTDLPAGVEIARGGIEAPDSNHDRSMPTALALPLACSGLHSAAIESVRRWLAPAGLAVVPGGKALGGGPLPSSLEPGSAVAVDILRGDVQMSAIGTLTYRDGNRVLLFGHPFFQSGEVRLPLSTAEITTIVSSEVSSFKLGVRGRDAGVVQQDRRAAVSGTLGGSVHLLPVTVRIEGEGRAPQTFHFESIEDRTLAPSLVGIAALNSLLESGGSGANQTLRWSMRLRRPHATPLTISDIAAGDSPSGDVMTGIASPLRFLYNNPYGRFALDSVEVTLRVEPGREQWTLRNARLLDATVRPGGDVRVACEIERWHGERETRQIMLHVPEEAPNGRYTLWIGGGGELSRYEANKLPARYRPTSLDDAWDRLEHTRPSDGLYAVLFAHATEVTSDGKDYPELPLSALAMLSSAQSSGDRSRLGDTAKMDEFRLPLDGMTRGELLLPVVVDSKSP
jgi:SpoIVB peptidase S55